jgi:hypothetical protein
MYQGTTLVWRTSTTCAVVELSTPLPDIISCLQQIVYLPKVLEGLLKPRSLPHRSSWARPINFHSVQREYYINYFGLSVGGLCVPLQFATPRNFHWAKYLLCFCLQSAMSLNSERCWVSVSSTMGSTFGHSGTPTSGQLGPSLLGQRPRWLALTWRLSNPRYFWRKKSLLGTVFREDHWHYYASDPDGSRKWSIF